MLEANEGKKKQVNVKSWKKLEKIEKNRKKLEKIVCEKNQKKLCVKKIRKIVCEKNWKNRV